MISVSPAWNTGNAVLDKVPIYAFEIQGYSRIFANAFIPGTTAVPWLCEDPPIDDMSTTVSDLDGGAELPELIVHVQDGNTLPSGKLDNLITADFPNFVFEGKKCYLKSGWGHIDPESLIPIADTAYANFATLCTMKIDSVESQNANLEYCFTASDIRTELLKAIWTTGDDGFPTDSNHPRTVLGHPLDIFLAACETEAGISSADIDVAKITAYRTLYSGAEMEFKITSPPEGKSWLEAEIMKPMGMYMWTNNLGQVTINSFYPLSVTPVFAFSPDNLSDIPAAGQADLINEVVSRLDDDGSDLLTTKVTDYAPSVSKYGLVGQQIIESKGLRSGLNGIFLAVITANLIFLRYGSKALCHGDNGKNTPSDPIQAIWDACLLEPGDLVTLSHPDVPDRVTGTMGITNKSYVVMDRTWQFFSCNVQLKLLEIDLSKFKQFLITTNGQADYTASSAGDKATLMFMCGDDDKYSNGDPANTLC